MSDGKNSIFKTILDFATDEEQQEKLRRFSNNVNDVCKEVKYWSDSSNYENDEKRLQELREERDTVVYQQRNRRIAMAVITLLIVIFL